MTFSWYPDFLDNNENSNFSKFMKKDLIKRFDLILKVRDFLKVVEKTDDLNSFYKSQEIKKIEGLLQEMRIPPDHYKNVVRIYFCINPEDNKNIIILDQELKATSKAGRIDNAKKRLKIYLDYLRKIQNERNKKKYH